MSIERTFGMVIARWRFLRQPLYMENIDNICKTFTTSCILNNFSIDSGDLPFEEEEEQDQNLKEDNDDEKRSVDEDYNHNLSRLIRDHLINL